MSTAVATAAALARAWIYLRISEDRENDELGIARQEKSLRAEAKRLGLVVAGVLIDNDVSAYRGRRRKGFEALLASLGQGDYILTTEVTRLTRGNLRVIEDLIDVVEAKRVTIHALRAGSLDLSTSGGRMVARMLGVIARQESEQMGERMSAKHAQSAHAGKAPTGTLQFGYRRVGGTIEPDPETAPIVRELAERLLAGESLTSLCRELNARGITTTLGNKWQTTVLSRCMKSPTLAAIRTYKREVVGPGEWEPVLDRATHERLVSALTHAKRGARPRAALLGGLAVCGVCGTRMQRKHFGAGQLAYQCPADHGCGSNTASAPSVERIVIETLLGYVAGIDLRQARAQLAGADGAQLAADLADDERMLTELADDLGAKRIARSEWLAARAPIVERIETTRTALAALDRPVPSAELLDAVTPERWDGLTFAQRREVLTMFIASVTIAKARVRRPGNQFDEVRVNGYEDEATEEWVGGRIEWLF
ncbi:MAG TPA: recombinase family protein [Ilumatobacter sp.]|nr:recombinase family protein [Ilumatobacter sp.]